MTKTYLAVFRELSQIFDAPNYQEDHKTGILIDLFYHVIQFCRENSFTQEQTSAFFSIVKKTHEICTGIQHEIHFGLKGWPAGFRSVSIIAVVFNLRNTVRQCATVLLFLQRSCSVSRSQGDYSTTRRSQFFAFSVLGLNRFSLHVPTDGLTGSVSFTNLFRDLHLALICSMRMK